MKGIQIREKEVQLSFTGDRILYTEKLQEFLRLLKLINSTESKDTRAAHKNQLCFYVPAVNDLKRNLRKLFHLP